MQHQHDKVNAYLDSQQTLRPPSYNSLQRQNILCGSSGSAGSGASSGISGTGGGSSGSGNHSLVQQHHNHHGTQLHIQQLPQMLSQRKQGAQFQVNVDSCDVLHEVIGIVQQNVSFAI